MMSYVFRKIANAICCNIKVSQVEDLGVKNISEHIWKLAGRHCKQENYRKQFQAPFVFHNKFHVKRLGSIIIMKLNFLKIFDSLLTKYLIPKESLTWISRFNYLWNQPPYHIKIKHRKLARNHLLKQIRFTFVSVIRLFITCNCCFAFICFRFTNCIIFDIILKDRSSHWRCSVKKKAVL